MRLPISLLLSKYWELFFLSEIAQPLCFRAFTQVSPYLINGLSLNLLLLYVYFYLSMGYDEQDLVFLIPLSLSSYTTMSLNYCLSSQSQIIISYSFPDIPSPFFISTLNPITFSPPTYDLIIVLNLPFSLVFSVHFLNYPLITYDSLIRTVSLPIIDSFCWPSWSDLKKIFNHASRTFDFNCLTIFIPQGIWPLTIQTLKSFSLEILFTTSKNLTKLHSFNQMDLHFIKFPAPSYHAIRRFANLDSHSIKFPAHHLIRAVEFVPSLAGPESIQNRHYQHHKIQAPLQLPPFLSIDVDEQVLWETPFMPEEDDNLFLFPNDGTPETKFVFTAYKRVDKKIHPVSTSFPEDCHVTRQVPEDPLLTLPPLSMQPPEFIPTKKISEKRMAELNVNSESFLWPEEEKLFKHIMVLNEEGIAFEDVERGTLKESYFSPYIIPTVPHRPWEERNIPIPPGLKEKVIDVLKLKMDAGVYEHSQSSYRSKWFVVLKKNGKLRIVHDLQPLNRITIRDAGMLPIVDDFVEGFAGHQCYTVFDLFWGFDARKIHPKSRELTAFMTPLGLLQITSLPTGFTNSPAEFQKCMVIVLQDEIPHAANIFIDDLPIKGPKTQYLQEDGTPEVLNENKGIRRFIWEHAQDVHRIMHRVKAAGATFASNKAQICLPEVLIVGQRCNAKGREPDKAKISKIIDWPALTNPKEVRRFLGLCGTMRIWIPNYSTVVKPLSELYHKDKEFLWDDRRQAAFDQIKQAITTAPALMPIDYQSDRPVVLSVDSSQEAVGMILSQIDERGRKRPARFGSIPMSERESRYSQPKLELFGLYRALRHWRIYIIGVKKLVIEVDAKYIKGMLNDPDLQPNAAINRWIQGILLFSFELVHVPAKNHKGPDALSRRSLAEGEKAESDNDSWLDGIALLTFFPDLKTSQNPIQPDKPLDLMNRNPTMPFLSLATRVSQEEMLSDIKHFLKTLETPIFPDVQKKRRFFAKAMEFIVKEDKLFKRNGNHPPLLVIFNPDQKLSILRQAHEDMGHRGVQAVYEILRHRFFWPHIRADVHHHVKSCHECQVRSLKRTEIPLTVSTPTKLFSKIYVDIMHMPTSADKKVCIVAARDDLSGTCEAKALANKTAEELRTFFWEQIYCRYGAPEHVITDNGSEIKGAFAALLKRLKIPHIRITPYNHHANGVVERGHFTLRESIIKACQTTGTPINRWPEKLAEALFADRITISRVTGFSPYQLLHGTDPVLPLDLVEATFMAEGFHAGMTTSELLALRMKQLSKHPDDVARAAQVLKKARFESKEQFERRFLHRLSRDTYQKGELVLVRNTQIEMSHNRKHKVRYLGPYVVVSQSENGYYWVKEMDGALYKHKIVPSRLLPYITRKHAFMKNNAQGQTNNSESESSDTGSSD